MVIKLSDNIISPLGFDSASNYAAVAEGRSMIRRHEGVFGLPEPFTGSLLDREAVGAACREAGICGDYTFFEQISILSASVAIADAGIDAASADCLFVLSSTKGNVELLEADRHDERAYIGGSAERIARHFGNRNTPVVASNACISGVCAQIAAVRALLSGRYRTAVVIGADVLSKFIVSGFQSFKALSVEPCRPYDKDRTGLNLGEAAATIILQRSDSADTDAWHYLGSSIHNDANHISGPSRTGEGAYRVLTDLKGTVDVEKLAFVNAHGTGTLYNDEMESIAIWRAGLSEVPLCGLKGYYAHTLGAAGVMETILSMQAVDHGMIPGTRGFTYPGTSHNPALCSEGRPGSGTQFIKILSGFGGSNAGIAYGKGGMQ